MLKCSSNTLSWQNSFKCPVSLHFLSFHHACLSKRFSPFLFKFISLTTSIAKPLNDFSVPNEFLSQGSDEICLLLVTKLIQLQHKMKQIIHLSLAMPKVVPSSTAQFLKTGQLALSHSPSLRQLSVFITCGYQWLWDTINQVGIASLF